MGFEKLKVLGYIGFNLKKIDKIVKIDGTLRNDGKSQTVSIKPLNCLNEPKKVRLQTIFL
jgi:hypothetical protein